MSKVLPDEQCLFAYTQKNQGETKPLAAGQLQVKGRRCYVLDHNEAEVRLKMHWVSHPLSNGIMRRALEGFGRVKSVSPDVWRGDDHANSANVVESMYDPREPAPLA